MSSRRTLRIDNERERVAQEAARVMWFERLYCWLRFFERNVLYPAVFLGALTQSAYEMRKEKQFSLRYKVLCCLVH